MTLDLKQIPTEILIQHMGIYRALKINKAMALKVMEELDKRQQNGEVIDLKNADDVMNILKTVGKGYVAKVASSDQIPEILNDLKEKGISALKVSDTIIHLGLINQEQIKEAQEITGIIEVEQDRKVVENVASSKVFEVGKNSG